MEIEEQAALTSGADFWHTEPVAGLPSVMVSDGPHGVRKQVFGEGHGLLDSEPATCFPPAVALGSTWDVDLARRVGAALALECRAKGVSVLLGPGINLKRTPLGGRNFEYFAEDPILTGELATAWVEGLQAGGVGASLKHFAINSQETDRMRVSADVDERTLRELYLRAFQKVVQRARPWTVMCSYNRINGVYASQHPWLLTDVLRDEWGYEGLLVSDWGAVVDRVAAVRSGLDLTMPGPDAAGDAALAAAVRDGSLPAEALATAAGRVTALVRRALDNAPEGGASFDADAHHALAREVAGRGIVLLKNDGGLLPLPRDEAAIAVIGEQARTPRYQGGGSSLINPTRLDNALDEITALAGGEVRFAPGYDDPDAAAALAAESSVAVVFVGSDEETEGSDRAAWELPAAHLALVERVAAANPRTVVVLSNGAVLRTAPWDAAVPALVEGWLLGQAGGGAIADVLFGVVNPSGRLTETIPVRLADHPSYLDFPGEQGHVRYGEGIHVGYRGFDAREQEVAYPFGFGLSYTSFGYTGLDVSIVDGAVRVRVTVTNTGERDGREVVQVYAGLPVSRVRRAPRELKGFASVPVAAGASAGVEILVPLADLAYWDIELGRWVVEAGTYTFAVGASSRDLRATATITLAGDDERRPLTAQSTIGEWMADPRGAQVLGEAFAAMAASGGGAVAQSALDPAMFTLMASMPLDRVLRFAGGGDPAALVKAAN